MKKLFTLIALLGMCVSGAWAEEIRTTVFSLTDPTAPTEELASKTSSALTATISGGSALVYNGKDAVAQMVTSNQVNLAGSGNSYLKITLDYALAEGDVITLKDYNGNNITTADAFIVSTSTTKGSTNYTFPYEVNSTSALKGKKEIYFWKSAVNTIRTISIESSNIPVKMTYVDWNNKDQSFGDVKTAYIGYNNISNGTIGFANTGWGVNKVTFIQVDASNLPANATITGATLTASYNYADRNHNLCVGYNISSWSNDMTYNTATLSGVTQLEQQNTTNPGKSKNETKSYSHNILGAFTNDDDNIVTLLLYDLAAGGTTISNPTVRISYTTATPADYTIQYQDAEGNTLKESVTYTNGAIVGQPFTASAADMASFWANSKKYKYVSGNTNTNAQETNNVITLVFEEAPKYTITLNATGALSQELASAQVYEGENATIYFKKYIKNGSSWTYCNSVYSKNVQDNYYGWTFSNVSANTSKDITYIAADIDDAYEVEDMDLVGNEGSAIGAGSRMSNSKGRRLAAGAYVTTDALPAGIYTIVLCARADAGGSNSTSTISYGVVDNGTLIPSDAYFPTVKYGETTTVTITNIVIYEGQKFALYNNGAAVSNLASDYITLKRTGDIFTKTLGTTGFGTFSAACPVTVPAGVTVYESTLEGETLTATPCDPAVTIIPANTGVIFKAAENAEVTFVPSAEAGSAITTALTSAPNGVDGDGATIFGLLKNDMTFAKVMNGVTLAANSAYLSIPASAKNIRVVVGGTTGIENVASAKATNKAVKRIMNGQLVIEKAGKMFNAAGAQVK